MRKLTSASGLVLLLASSLFAQTNQVATTLNPTVAYVYVGSDAKPGKISAFASQSNNTLQAVSGSPFPVPSQNLVAKTGFVFGTDGKNIVTYSQAPSGALRAVAAINGVAHSPTPSESDLGSMTLDRGGTTLYAAEALSFGINAYGEFHVGLNGTLTFRGNAPTGEEISPLKFSRNNRFAYGHGCLRAEWNVFALRRASDGTLTMFEPGGFPPDSTGTFPCPGAMAVSGTGYLALAYSPDSSSTNNSVAIYRIDGVSGGLTLVSHSSVAITGTRGLQFDPTGTYLAIAGLNGIETFRLSSGGTLTLLGTRRLTNVSFVDLKWDNVGHVYAISTAGLYLFTAHNGVLQPIGSRHPVVQAGSLAVLPLP